MMHPPQPWIQSRTAPPSPEPVQPRAVRRPQLRRPVDHAPSWANLLAPLLTGLDVDRSASPPAETAELEVMRRQLQLKRVGHSTMIDATRHPDHVIARPQFEDAVQGVPLSEAQLQSERRGHGHRLCHIDTLLVRDGCTSWLDGDRYRLLFPIFGDATELELRRTGSPRPLGVQDSIGAAAPSHFVGFQNAFKTFDPPEVMSVTAAPMPQGIATLNGDASRVRTLQPRPPTQARSRSVSPRPRQLELRPASQSSAVAPAAALPGSAGSAGRAGEQDLSFALPLGPHQAQREVAVEREGTAAEIASHAVSSTAVPAAPICAWAESSSTTSASVPASPIRNECLKLDNDVFDVPPSPSAAPLASSTLHTIDRVTEHLPTSQHPHHEHRQHHHRHDSTSCAECFPVAVAGVVLFQGTMNASGECAACGRPLDRDQRSIADLPPHTDPNPACAACPCARHLTNCRRCMSMLPNTSPLPRLSVLRRSRQPQHPSPRRAGRASRRATLFMYLLHAPEHNRQTTARTPINPQLGVMNYSAHR